MLLISPLTVMLVCVKNMFMGGFGLSAIVLLLPVFLLYVYFVFMSWRFVSVCFWPFWCVPSYLD